MNNSSPSDKCILPKTSDTINSDKEIQCAWSVEDLLFEMEDALYDTYSDYFDQFYLREREMQK